MHVNHLFVTKPGHNTAQNLLNQTVREGKVNVVIIADQYRNLDGFNSQRLGSGVGQ